MRRLPAVALPVIALCALAGCGSPEATPRAASPSAAASTSAAPSSAPATSAPPTTTPTSTPTPTPEATPSRKPTSRIKDCFDGDCLLKVSRPVTIPLNAKKFYYPKFEIVSVKSKTLTYWVEYPHGGGAQQVMGEGSRSSFGFRSRTPVEVSLVSIEKGKALLSISPGKRGG
ncbi:hypothetical protein [Nonomuraea sp. NPDC049400]|uniref:hypothetical protein n=1 Tax=Nonomuraea sp. NPDC049400 TaxID=3364352 RepID=UPI0037B1E348